MIALKNYFSRASNDYRQFRPRYPEEFFDYLARVVPTTGHAWDCGCGNGQASVALAARFTQVNATDVSEAQISQAIARPNIDYAVSPAEEIAARDSSLDLIAVAQAIHWFDRARFFAEVDRTLKPGGVLAAWGYQLLYADAAVDRAIEHFHTEIVGPYWPPGRELLDEGYARIDFPYPREKAPPFTMRSEWRFQQLTGYLNTWSAVKRYEEVLGNNPVENYRDALLEAWGGEECLRRVYWPLILYVGKKPR